MFKKLDALPRDSRDTLFLLFVIAWVVLPQVGELPLWCSLLFASVLGWRGLLAVQNRPLPSKWWLVGLLVVTVAATWFTYRTMTGRDAGVTLIVVLLALKTLELRAKRDAFVVFFLSFFTLLTNFFFSQSLLTAAAMLIALLGLLTALVNTHMPVGKPPLLQAAKTAGFMALLGAPVMAVLFVLFPRMAPLWGVPSDAMTGRSGLSPNMVVGAIAKLALDSSIAMRLKFNGEPPDQAQMYFRGPVLSRFDGREWQPSRAGFGTGFGPAANASLQTSGTAYDYEVTLEPTQRPWLLVLDATPERPQIANTNAVMTRDMQWVADRTFNDLARYKARSYPDFQYAPIQSIPQMQEFLALPLGINPRTQALAAQMKAEPRLQGASAMVLVEAVLNRLKTGGYSYTLEPGVYGQHTADEFWFDRKEGFCEHIASSFVLLTRALGVPARVVTGYQGGERNGVDGFWVVRQSDAHAWAEVWVAGRGWVRVDPTSSVAPGRTASLQRLQAQQGLLASALGGAFGTFSPTLLSGLRNAWEAVNNSWNQWVLNYSESKQMDLLKNIGFGSPSWEDLGYVLAGMLVLVSLCGAAWTLWERNRHDPWLRLLQQATQRLAKAGFVIAPNSPPRSVADQLKQKPYDGAGVIRDWLLRLEALRYAPQATARLVNLSLLMREFKQLPWPK